MVGEARRSGADLSWRRRIVASWMIAVMVTSTLAIGLLVLPGGARGAAAPGAAAAPFRIFTVGDPRLSVATLNPLVMTSAEEFIITYNVYSTLLTYDGNYQLRNDLAWNYTIGSDQRTWTFHLVPDAYFTDPSNPGDRSHPVTAADVVFSYRLNLNETASIFNSYMTQFTWQDITAPDALTVQMVTAEPFAGMYTAASVIPIFPEYVWSGVNNPVRYSNANPIGSGAMYYDVANTSFGSNFVLRRNPNYYGVAEYCQVSRPDEVVFAGYTSSATMVADFKSGTTGLDAIAFVGPADYIGALPSTNDPNGIEKFAADAGFVAEFNVNVITPEIRASNSQFRTGTNNPLLLNYTVRKALAMSVNKTALVQYALLGLGREADTLVPSANPWHYAIPESEKFQFDPAAARAMLNDAGWKYDSAGNLAPGTTPLYKAGGTDPLQFRFYVVNTYAAFQAAANNITQWLYETGIQTTDARANPGYHVYTYNQMVGIWFSADYDLWIWDWIFSPVSDPSLDILEVETTMAIGPTSDNYYSNSTFDALYNQSLVTLDPTARRAITDEMQRMVYKYASYILPYYQLSLYAATNGRPPSYTSGWTNYGDWSQRIGDTPDSDLPNLWFRIEPLDNRAPVISSFPDVQWVSGSAATISATAADPEGQALAYTFDFGDGSAPFPSSSPTVTHTYAQPGTYAISVRASDSEWPVCRSATATIAAPGSFNLPPVATLQVTAPHQTFAYVGENVDFTLSVNDTEGDPVSVTWAFGDGASTSSYVTGTTSTKTIQVTHAYATAGTYTATITYTDNQTGPIPHSKTLTASVEIRTQAGGGGPTNPEANPWINYGVPIAIVLAILVAAAAIFVRRRRRVKREEEGGPPEPPPPPPS